MKNEKKCNNECINNTKYYNDSLAYDFDMFLPKEKREHKDNIVQLPPQPKKRTRPKQKIKTDAKTIAKLFVVATSIIILAMAGIGMRAEINEVNNEIENVRNEINKLDAQKTELMMEYEEMLSYSNLELKAAELGMVKRQQGQVKYIKVNNKNKAITKDGKTLYSEN